jgi:hypothetical protein
VNRLAIWVLVLLAGCDLNLQAGAPPPPLLPDGGLTVTLALPDAGTQPQLPERSAPRDDDGPVDNQPPLNPCDANPGWQECQGTVLAACRNGRQVFEDCAPPSNAGPGQCGPIDSAHPEALVCKRPFGADCLVERPDGELQQLACAGANAGCVLDPDSSCETGVGKCTAAQVGSCRGDSVVMGCLVSQPLLFSCAGRGYRCEAGVCRGARAGSPCAPGLIECDEGTCKEGAPGKFTCDVPRGNDCPAGCNSPPAGRCDYSHIKGRFTAISYPARGRCESPPANACYYPPSSEQCAEACSGGVCVPGPACSLTSGCTPPLGCKAVSDTEMRCIPVDDNSAGQPCDDEIPGMRCRGHHKCVWPSFATTSICARLCQSHADCGGGGLRGQGQCVKDGTAGAFFGYCR